MANVNFSGVLLDPLGEYAHLDAIRFTHATTTGQTLAGSMSLVELPADGTYDFNIEYGNVLIETRDKLRNKWFAHGTFTINADTTETTLPALLGAATPVSDQDLITFQALVAQAEAAATEAEQYRDEILALGGIDVSEFQGYIDAAQEAADNASTSAQAASTSAANASTLAANAAQSAVNAQASADEAISSVNDISTQVDALQNDTESLESSVASIVSSVSTLQDSSASQTTAINTNTADIANLIARVIALENGAALDTVDPVFTSGTTASIEEGTGAGQVVYTAIATDESAITYNLSGTDASYFTIGTQTGQVTLTGDPDFATKSSYEFTVTAIDTSLNTSSVNVTLTVTESDNTVNLWTYDDPLTLPDTVKYGYMATAGSISANLTVGEDYIVSFVVVSAPETADFQFNVGGSSIRLSGASATGQHSFSVPSADNTLMIFQEFAGAYGSSGTIIQDIVVYADEGAAVGGTGSEEYEALNFSIEQLTQTYENNYLNSLPTRPDNDDSYWAFESNSWLIFYADMYRVTGDVAWIVRGVGFCDYLLDNTDIKRDERGEWNVTALQQPYVDGNYYQAPNPYALNGTPVPGWSTINISASDLAAAGADVRRVEILTDGQVCAAICAVADCILDYPTELSAYTTKATEYLTYCKTVLDSHENSWVENRSIDGTTPDNSTAVTATIPGWYYYPDRLTGSTSTYSLALPMNHLAGAMYAGMVIHKHGVSSFYQSRAITVMDFIRSSTCRSEVDGKYLWRYGFDDAWNGQGSEDLNHGAIMLGQWFKFARENNYHGFDVAGFDVTEMTPYSEALFFAMQAEDPAAESFDGSGGVLPGGERADPAHMAWLCEYKDGLYDELVSLTNDYAGTGNMTYSRLYRAYSSIYLYLDSQGLL